METLGFTHPVLRVDLVPEYKSALYDLGLADWLIVREKLHTHYADEVIVALIQYKDAFLSRKAAEWDWFTKDWGFEKSMAYAQIQQTRIKECETYATLSMLCMWSLQLTQEERERREEDWERIAKDFK
jgi:hypothetical protein